MLVRKVIGFEVDEIDVGNSDVSEDILALRIKYKSCGEREGLVVVI